MRLAFTALFASLLFYMGACKHHKADTPAPAKQDTTHHDTTHHDTTHTTPADTFVTATSSLALYEINLRAQGTTAQSGQFTDIAARLDSIKALGCNTVWLMPIYPVGQVRSAGGLGSPYAVKDYTAVNPEFGTLADLRGLAAAAHARHMSIMLDWVANHTSWDNPWLAAHPEWYTQVNGQVISPAGTNWADVADLNYGSAPMRQAMIAAMRYWIADVGVDGLRCDAADMVPADFWRQALDSLKRIPTPRPLIFLAEGSQIAQLTAGFQMLYAWDYYSRLKAIYGAPQYRASNLYFAGTTEYSAMPAGTQRLRYTTNHDETAWNGTPLEYIGGIDGALSASVPAICAGGVPLIYNGQEVGCPTRLPLFTRSVIDYSANPTMRQAYKQLLRLRAATPALRVGTLAEASSSDVIAFVRTAGASQAVVLCNVRATPQTYTPLPTIAALPRQGWRNQAGAADSLSASITLPAYGYKVLVR